MTASRVVAVSAAWLLLASAASFAQESYAPEVPDKEKEKRELEVGKWYPRVELGVNLTQAAYSDNWNGDEKSSISWAAYINGLAEKQVSPSLNWLNTLRMVYGQTREEEVDANGVRSWGDTEESADQIDFESTLRLTKGWPVDPYASFRWESYFRDTADPSGRSLWFNPMTFKESVGIARKLVDQEHHQFLVRAGVGARETYRRFYAGPTGDATESESAWDSGAELVLQ
jgi:hypothetical protein